LPVALQRLQAALKIDAGYPPAISRLAQTYLDLNQLDKAQAEFSKLLDIKDFQAAGHNGLGQVLLLKHEYAQAVEHFTRALELEPEATRIHYPLAQALRALGKNELAQSHLREYGDPRSAGR
jgi:Tfp pilus assembly protein PilF